MYKSEIRPSTLSQLSEKVRKQNYGKYLNKITLEKCRSFNASPPIAFDFPVTALIGPNGGGKTTILGACGILYRSIPPRQFFTRNKQLDKEMKDWSISYEAVDKKVNSKDTVRRKASFGREKWSRSALDREVLFFGVSRTLPAVERRELSRFTISRLVLHEENMKVLGVETARQIEKILGKDVRKYSEVKISKGGAVSLLSGETQDGKSYSEFHFGAGESSVIKMIIGIESIGDNALVLIEEIENGLHPLAVVRLVDYLIEVAKRKSAQIVFTTHSEYATLALPPDAIWAALNGSAVQGKLEISALRIMVGDISSQLTIFSEDEFAKKWINAIFRDKQKVAFDAVDIFTMGGDGAAVKMNKSHNEDPSTTVPSICVIDGDSQQQENADCKVFRLPGQMPESYIFETVIEKMDDVIGILTVRLMQRFDQSERVKEVIRDIRRSNRDPHLLFAQIGERLGFISESNVIDAFLATWCQYYPDVADRFFDQIKSYLPFNLNSRIL